MSEDSGEDFGGSSGGFANATGWSGSNKLTTGDRSTEASAAANFKDPSDYTVQFTLTPLGPDSPPQPPFPIPGRSWATIVATATIRFSVKGVTVTRKVSVASGISVTGVGQAISVVVDDESVDTYAANLDLGRPYQVGFTISKGSRGSDTNPPILFGDSFVLNTLSQHTVPIPQNVGVKSVLIVIASGGLGGAPPAPIPEQAVQAFVGGGRFTAAYDPRSQGFVPIPPGSTEVTVSNETPAQVRVAVYFGIDG